jgi:murein DD-endopeptidase MepM/ murein hydrolase activator NlpD
MGGSRWSVLAQRYAIDYVKVDAEGRTYKGDSPSGRLTNGDFYARGEEVLSVADGMVVQTNDRIPENEPGFNSFAVPITLTTLVGNNVVIDIGGDRVRRGQVLGLVGNTGGSTQPHLHFQLTDGSAPGTSTMGAEGIPYAHERIDVLGQCKLASPMACTRPAAVTLSNAMPAYNQIVRFPVAAPPVDSSATRRR